MGGTLPPRLAPGGGNGKGGSGQHAIPAGLVAQVHADGSRLFLACGGPLRTLVLLAILLHGRSPLHFECAIHGENEHRPWELYQTVFHQLLGQCQSQARGSKKFRFNNKLVSVDSTSIDLCAEIYDWARYKRTKGAVKLHLVLDHEGYLPCFAVITDGKSHDVTVGRTLRFERGTIVAMDKGYVDFKWWKQMTRDGVYFVTRWKQDLQYEAIADREVPPNSKVRKDVDIRIQPYRQDFELHLRLVTVWDEAKQEELTFLTNHLKFGATTIARIYKERWQIELFFKSLKRLLRVKTFVGTSANALKTQLWTALIAMLLLKYLHLKSTFNWSFSNLVALLRQQLFVYRDLFPWLDDPFQAPPALAGVHDVQLGLEFQGF
jgi:hypothetical protein